MYPEPYCLLIDNDEDDREVFAMAPAEMEPQLACRSFASGPEALRALDADPGQVPAFIFIDMNMPCMDGSQCFGALQERSWLAGVPVYLYSTAADPRVVAQLDGIAGFIEKPTSFGGLMRLLEGIVHPERV
jgi:DNA-binding NtrC family response regulator